MGAKRCASNCHPNVQEVILRVDVGEQVFDLLVAKQVFEQGFFPAEEHERR
jgi:hypothetical protein